MKEELYQIIEKYNGNANKLLESIYKEYNYHYIECQLWDNDYIKL
jgi:hypothetical protein